GLHHFQYGGEVGAALRRSLADDPRGEAKVRSGRHHGARVHPVRVAGRKSGGRTIRAAAGPPVPFATRNEISGSAPDVLAVPRPVIPVIPVAAVAVMSVGRDDARGEGEAERKE